MSRPATSLTYPGWAIVGAIAVLFLIGVASIYVTDTHYISDHDGPWNAAKQCVFLLVGLAGGALAMRVGYQAVGRHAYVLFVAAVCALVPLAIARTFHITMGGLTAPRNGAYRWINLPGYQLQPSEFMKVAFLIALAWYLRYRSNYRRFQGLLLPFLISLVPLALILIQPDLGTALLLVPVLFVMLFVAGARIVHLAIIALVGVAALPLAWDRLQPYQRLRITAVLMQNDSLRQAVIDQPEKYEWIATKRQAVEWAASSGYQLVHSKNAIGSGGLIGYGWGDGLYVEQSLLPDRHNDFIFSVIAHQWGLFGCLLVMAAYGVIVIAGMRIASVTPEPFARLLAVGVVTLIAMQVLINLAMTVGLLPITGMTLPFVSYGGSSLLSNFLAVGLLISVAQHRPFLLGLDPFEHVRRFVDRRRLTERVTAGAAEAAGEADPSKSRVTQPQHAKAQ